MAYYDAKTLLSGRNAPQYDVRDALASGNQIAQALNSVRDRELAEGKVNLAVNQRAEDIDRAMAQRAEDMGWKQSRAQVEDQRALDMFNRQLERDKVADAQFLQKLALEERNAAESRALRRDVLNKDNAGAKAAMELFNVGRTKDVTIDNSKEVGERNKLNNYSLGVQEAWGQAFADAAAKNPNGTYESLAAAANKQVGNLANADINRYALQDEIPLVTENRQVPLTPAEYQNKLGQVLASSAPNAGAINVANSMVKGYTDLMTQEAEKKTKQTEVKDLQLVAKNLGVKEADNINTITGLEKAISKVNTKNTNNDSINSLYKDINNSTGNPNDVLRFVEKVKNDYSARDIETALRAAGLGQDTDWSWDFGKKDISETDFLNALKNAKQK